MAALLILLGLALLVFGGDYLVKGATGIALHLDIPQMLVGMTVVALGTSAPELVVTVQAALQGKPDIAIGNVVGSNIANVALILGMTAIIFPMVIKKSSLKFDWVVMIIATIGFYLFSTDNQISRWEGILFLLALASYITFSFYRVRKLRKKHPEVQINSIPVDESEKSHSLLRLILYVVLGTGGLILGAGWLLDGAETVARYFGVSDRVIAISLVAFGTSLPELATSVIAAFKRQEDISLGNIIGSNLFNILAILGVTAIIHPIDVSSEILSSDYFWMLGTSLAILPLSIRRLRLGRLDGALLLGAYIAFMYFLLF